MDPETGRDVDEASCLVGLNTRQDAPSTFDYRFFDPHAEIENVAGNLPHWRQDSVLYFMTFRTADALPAEKLLTWQKEKEAWAATHPEPWDAATRAEYLERFPCRLERWLDAGAGECLLARPELRAFVESAIRHFDGVRYQLDESVVAANHVHVLVAPLPGNTLSGILHSWKSYTGVAVNRAIRRVGTLWQQESYDHIVRTAVALHRIRNYIRNHTKPAAPQ